MSNKPAKGSAFIIKSGLIAPHRRPKANLSIIGSYISHTAGDALYYVGARVERARKTAWRSLRHGIKRAARAFRRGQRAVLGAVSDKLLEFFEDIFAVVKKVFRSFRSLFVVIKASADRGALYTMQRVKLFFKYGWLWNKRMIGRIANVLLPLASLALCVLVISSMLSLNYALQVNYRGQTVGYVDNETIYDNARKIIQNRMVASDNSASWGEDATLSVTVVPEGNVSTQDEMAVALLAVSGEEIAQATGLYVGGTFIGATTAGELLSDELDALLAPHQSEAVVLGSEAIVKFAREVELVSGVYPAESILPYEDLLAVVKSDEADDIYYIAKGGELAAEVAALNGISYDRLVELNGPVDETLEEGKILLVAQNEPLFRVKTVIQEIRYETVAFETLAITNPLFEVGYLWTKTEGENGERTIVVELEYSDGELVSETEISNTITKEPVNKEIIRGSLSSDGSSQISVATGELVWPTATGYRVSRGFTSGNHHGVDIAANIGTAIYAADNGVVMVSQWTDTGYGYYIIIDHQNGMQTLYGHCSELYVSVGDSVNKGEVIAGMGSTGNSTGSHLHFEVIVDGSKVDPYLFLY
ncbi:MAG: peptidoglycan DD-metalloendopeptidase family protein [Oscillospiraceae bacterium]|nr:peptidoglycan DD-metalloendopeptidase family protein [Oscillospiraceae bacterium]